MTKPIVYNFHLRCVFWISIKYTHYCGMIISSINISDINHTSLFVIKINQPKLRYTHWSAFFRMLWITFIWFYRPTHTFIYCRVSHLPARLTHVMYYIYTQKSSYYIYAYNSCIARSTRLTLYVRGLRNMLVHIDVWICGVLRW